MFDNDKETLINEQKGKVAKLQAKLEKETAILQLMEK